jgi:hypothetical protein
MHWLFFALFKLRESQYVQRNQPSDFRGRPSAKAKNTVTRGPWSEEQTWKSQEVKDLSCRGVSRKARRTIEQEHYTGTVILHSIRILDDVSLAAVEGG